jgi:hypothetical protein
LLLLLLLRQLAPLMQGYAGWRLLLLLLLLLFRACHLLLECCLLQY